MEAIDVKLQKMYTTHMEGSCRHPGRSAALLALAGGAAAVVLAVFRPAETQPASGLVVSAAWWLSLALCGYLVFAAAVASLNRAGGAGARAAAAFRPLVHPSLRRLLGLAVSAGLAGAAWPAGALASPTAPVAATCPAALPPLDWPGIERATVNFAVGDCGVPGSARPAAPRSPAPPVADPVLVHAGDTLWSIAAAHLPPQRRTSAAIAAEWPRWWQANRGVIGTDPDLIRPGERLVPPHDFRRS
jgi:hypothetical protein